MATLKLFHQDAFRTTFEATVLRCVQAEAGWDVELDQTCFYATNGGQPHDEGLLGGHRVLDVREDEADVIIHTVEAPLSGQISGEIDWHRRLDHMEQHSGQHLLSGAFEQLLDAETVSWHLGADSCTVDLAIDSLTALDADRVEMECNRVIRLGMPILTHVVDQAGVAAFPLRKPPKVMEDVRVVEIKGYDWSACGGTHVRTVGELSLVKIKSWEKNKRNTRVEFLVGGRARSDYAQLDSITRDLCRFLSIGVNDLPRYIERSQEEASTLRKQVKLLQERLLEIEAAELVAESRKLAGVRVVRHVFGGRPVDELKLLASKVTAQPGTVAIFGTKGAMPQIILQRSVDLRLDVGAVIRQILPLIDGKGGGSPVQAQGAGSRPEALEYALDQTVSKLTEALLS